MDIQKEREAFEKHASKFFTDSKEAFKTNGDQYLYDEVIWMWDCWIERAKAQAVPEGFVLVPEDQAKDTERLNFLLGGNHNIRTVVPCDIENEDYQKTGEHFLFTEVYWIDGWDYHENTSSQNERGAIDKAMIEAQEPAND